MKYLFLPIVIFILLFTTKEITAQPIDDTLLWISFNNTPYASFSPDGKWVLMRADTFFINSGLYKIYPATLRDAKTGEIIFSFIDSENDQVYKAKFSPDGKYVVTSDIMGQIYIWNINERRIENIIKYDYQETLGGWDFSPDGRKIAIFSWNYNDVTYKIKEREFPSGKISWETNTQMLLRRIQYVNGTNYLYAEKDSLNNVLQGIFLDAETGKIVKETIKDESIYPGRIYSKNGIYYAQTSGIPDKKRIAIHDSKNDNLILSIPMPEYVMGYPVPVTFTPKGDFIFFTIQTNENSSTRCRTEVWSIATGAKVHTYQYSRYPKLGYALIDFSPDLQSLLLVTGGSVEVFKSDWNITSITDNLEAKPFTLTVNSNNPANVPISFNLLKESHADLSLFDMEGKLVEVLKAGYFPFGNNTYIWNSSHLPQGIYFILLKANGKTESKKIVIEK